MSYKNIRSGRIHGSVSSTKRAEAPGASLFEDVVKNRRDVVTREYIVTVALLLDV